MITRKDAPVISDERNPLNRSALSRKDMRRGRQVLVYNVVEGITMRATIMSSPFSGSPKRPSRENGTRILLRNDELGTTEIYYLSSLGVVSGAYGDWDSDQYLLDANKYDSQQLREDGSDPLDPPERS